MGEPPAAPSFGNAPQLTVLRRPEAPSRPLLVFLRASGGARSLLYPELTRSDRCFDLAVSYYGEPREDKAIFSSAEYVLTGGLSKFHAVKLALDGLDVFSRYSGYFFPDADLVFSEAEIDGFLRFCLANQRDLAQPSVTADSYYSWPITLKHPSFLWRDTNFVEIMAPYLSPRALTALAPTFSESISGWGLDMVWPRLLPAGAKVGIADCFSLRHTRPIDTKEGPFYRYLASLGISPAEEADRLLKKHGLTAAAFRPRTTGIVQSE